MAKKTMPFKARLLLTALEPRAMPSAKACIHSPIVVLESPFVDCSSDGFDDVRSKRGVAGIDDIGIDIF